MSSSWCSVSVLQASPWLWHLNRLITRSLRETCSIFPTSSPSTESVAHARWSQTRVSTVCVTLCGQNRYIVKDLPIRQTWRRRRSISQYLLTNQMNLYRKMVRRRWESQYETIKDEMSNIYFRQKNIWQMSDILCLGCLPHLIGCPRPLRIYTKKKYIFKLCVLTQFIKWRSILIWVKKINKFSVGGKIKNIVWCPIPVPSVAWSQGKNILGWTYCQSPWHSTSHLLVSVISCMPKRTDSASLSALRRLMTQHDQQRWGWLVSQAPRTHVLAFTLPRW